MFRMKVFSFTVFSVFILVISCSAQKLTEAQVLELVNSRQFQFKAQYMYPSGGKSKALTENYTLTVKPDEVIADLPYVGKAYNATMNQADVGVKFVSKEFGWEMKEGKKDGWEITITPKDGKDVRNCQLTVYDNGNANLMVNSNNRQSISYSGEIVALEKKVQ